MGEALSGPGVDRWKEAMDEELQGLQGKGSFKDVAPPAGTSPVETRYIFKIKRAADGTVERYKAGLVARGFTPRPRMDSFEAFSPIVGFDVLRNVLATTAPKGWSRRALDFE